jgi:hypothetical protein
LNQFALPRVDWGPQLILRGSRELASPGVCADNPVAWNSVGRWLTMKSENEKAKPCYRRAIKEPWHWVSREQYS